MKKAYYLFHPGRMSRTDNTLKFEPVATTDENTMKPRYLPVDSVSALYVFGSLDANSALFNFLGKQHVPVHFFITTSIIQDLLALKNIYWQDRC